MDRFDRQRRIDGWDQQRLADASVTVCGRGWLGSFTVWGLASLGVGHIDWLGSPCAEAAPFARWLLSTSGPRTGCEIAELPADLEYPEVLDWLCACSGVDALVLCSPDAVSRELAVAWASSHGVLLHVASAWRGGWLGPHGPSLDGEPEHPVPAMVAAALLVDSARESLVPLGRGCAAPGPLALNAPEPRGLGRWVLVGVGGIGVYAATLAASLGRPLHLVDRDRVEATNLNRQGLFGPGDAERGAFKAEAACCALRELFPGSRIEADPREATVALPDLLSRRQVPVVLSAVDNARTRLELARTGHDARIPVVQGGTDVWSADCYCQQPNGPALDTQMHGALAAAAGRESASHQGGCAASPSYVVPGMVAAGLMVFRALQALEGCRGLPPFLWRAGARPLEQQGGHDEDDLALVD